MKRSIQTTKPGYTVGIEFDNHAIRSVRLLADGRGSFSITDIEEVKGDFTDDGNLLDGFRQLKTKLGIGMKDGIVTCLTGKQVYASEIPFRKLNPEEMEQALRLELRKTVHFEVATSTLDYEIVDEDEGSGGVVHVLVALAANSVLKRMLSLLEKSGIKPTSVDVLPVAVANALWAWKGGSDDGHPLVALHIGPQISNIVVDGEHAPFFNRNIYFAAEDVFRAEAPAAEKRKKLNSLSEEVSRSLLFYEKNSGVSGFQQITLLGDFLEDPSLSESLSEHTGISVGKMDLVNKMGRSGKNLPGQFDLATALALRGEL
jgi:Tfp pilus assembly PilM family ATPase